MLPAVRLDPKDVIARIAWSSLTEKRIDEIFSEWDNPTLDIEFSDYLRRRDQTMRDAAGFVGADGTQKLGPQRFRRMITDPRVAIENWIQIRDELEGAGHRWRPEGVDHPGE